MQTDVFDLQGALIRLGGDEELFRDLVQYFFEDAPDLLEQVRTGLKEGNAELVERGAHSLKGLAANFGATQAIDTALSVERRGRDADLTAAARLLPELETQLDRLRQALAPYLPKGRA